MSQGTVVRKRRT